MSETLRILYERRSVRAFEDRAIGGREREAILRAAAEAPTAGNQQLYTIIDITDKEKRERLAVLCDNQPFITRAALCLVFCADCRKWYNAYLAAGAKPRAPGVGDLLLAVSDTNIAAENAVIAAETLGISSCYIGDVMERCEDMRALLSLPPYVFPAAMLVFGYAAESVRGREKPKRVDMRHILHENAYRDMDEGELREMWEERAGIKGFDAYIRAFCERKYNSDFSREMTRSVGAYLKDYTEK